MSWERFYFTCKLIRNSLNDGIDIHRAHRLMMSNPILKEFGGAIEPKSLTGSILNCLMTCNDSQQESVVKTLDIYEKIHPSLFTNKPNRARRAGYYLMYIAIVFFIMSAVYNFFVTPVFMNFFEATETKAPIQFILFVKYRYVLFIIISTLIIFLLIISNKIKNLFEFNENCSTSLIYKIFLGRSIKQNHQKIISLINMPMSITGIIETKNNSDLLSYFKSQLPNSNEIAEEISMLIEINMSKLIKKTELFLSILYAFLAIIIIFSIFQFLMSVYGPLFSMGELI